MITDSELRISNESYTRKDFYQIYPEILDLVNKITERWDPTSSNESDPGVVLLKLLAFIADKNNYNLDKNILECFMPSATQEDSMRKLCEMMGYNMKYYRSAETDVSFMWVGDVLPKTPTLNKYILIDRFTELQDESGEVNYVLTEPVTLTYKGEVVTKPAIEGKLQEVQINNDNLVRLFNLDDRRRFYLPESQVAENGIWIWKDPEQGDDPDFWKKVENLNIQQPGQTVWKFGFDNKRKLPYILFPEDIAELIGNGLYIKYIRTSGANGNITAQTLVKLAKLDAVNYYTNGVLDEENPTLPVVDDNDIYLVIQNGSYTTNGQDIETIDEAYNGFKKTIGTFDTLVTCRDYANKIYQLVYSDINTNPLVSNCQVSDIKDDINFANKIVSFDQFGIFYSDIPVKIGDVNKVTSLPTDLTQADEGKIYLYNNQYYQVVKLGSDYSLVLSSEESLNKMNNFDLYIYPLQDITNFYTSKNYANSFKPNYRNTYEIINQLNDYKTLCHNIKQISNSNTANDIYNIKNYYHLNARVSTTYKVSQYEGSQILSNIYYALWNAFNARKLDYGEEIPYDILLETMEKADTRIKSVSLEEPEITTSVMHGDGSEIQIINRDGSLYTDSASDNVKTFYKLLAKNVLAGKIPLFDYDNRFKYSVGQVNADNGRIYGEEASYAATDTTTPPVIVNGKYDGKYLSITHISSKLTIPIARISSDTYKLKENEVVNFIYPSLATVNNGIYSAYVNYFFKHTSNTTDPTPASLTNIKGSEAFDYFLVVIPDFLEEEEIPGETQEERQQQFTNIINRLAQNKRKLWYKENSSAQYYKFCTTNSIYDDSKTYYKTKNITDQTFVQVYNYYNQSLYAVVNTSMLNKPGYLIDNDHHLFKKIYSAQSATTTLYGLLMTAQKQLINSIAVYNSASVIFSDTSADTEGTPITLSGIPADTEYLLKDGDELYLNYTDSDNVVHNVLYWKDSGTGKFYKRDDITAEGTGIPSEFSGIIKPNFDLYDSATEAVSGSGRSWSKKTGFIWTTIPGMFALNGQQQIEVREFVETQIKESPTYCYWSLKNGGNLVLTKDTSISTPNTYEYILDNDEYFFYTDSLKNSLVTLGSGTSIKICSANDQGNQIILKLEDTNIDLDDIASKGIGAFSDTQWVSLKLGENYYLKICENQVISISEGDSLTGFQDDEFTALSGKWEEIDDPSGIKYNGIPLPSFDFDNAINKKWKVRAILNINMDSTDGQHLVCDTQTSNEVVQEINLYTSFWKNKWNNCYVEYTEENLAKGNITEVYETTIDPDVNTLLVNFKTSASNNKSYNLKSNYEINYTGGEYIDVHRYTIDNHQKDDLYIYPYLPEDIAIKTSSTGTFAPVDSVSMYADSYYKFALKEINSIRLPIFKPEECFDLIMIYYTPSDGITSYPQVTITTSEGVVQPYISLYRENYDRQHLASAVTLTPGINVIRLDVGGYLVIAKQDVNDVGSLVISDVSVVKERTENAKTGLNNALLNVPDNQSINFITNYLIKTDLDNIFYYNAPINKYNQVDVDKFDQNAFFNYNNICNKFVIAQLDSDFSDIQIAKSSRISKW